MKKVTLILFLICCIKTHSQHTFSILAIDSLTGEIGSAGATCGDSITWPATKGAKLISDIIPGKGVIHTQAKHNYINQKNAHKRLIFGDSPQKIIHWILIHDIVALDIPTRQYGIIDYSDGYLRTAAYTGGSCLNYKNHIIGSNYIIIGNILDGQYVLDSMETHFLNHKGTLAEKLLAALNGAKIVGADKRCSTKNTSSLSAFLRVAKPTDKPYSLYIDLCIPAQNKNNDPIDELNLLYEKWRINSSNHSSH